MPSQPTERVRQFASDNNAGICPEAWEAIARANQGHAPGYGDDHITTEASDLLRETFETDCEVFFVFNGTAANSLALSAIARSYHSLLCHDFAHVETDECGAPEFFSHGMKVLQLPGENGKIAPGGITDRVLRRRDIHYPKPKVVTLTQSTELGTVYSPDEIATLANEAREHGLKVHMDGARFANAVASLGCSPAETTWKAGVDVLCFGGTKMGMPLGEAVVFFDRSLADEFDYRCKQAGQLASKMRFLAAPWCGLLQNNAWIQRASHANQMAQLLAKGVQDLPGVSLLHPVQANAVFLQLNESIIEHLRNDGWKFYSFIGSGGCRFMCAWDTSPDDVLSLTQSFLNATS